MTMLVVLVRAAGILFGTGLVARVPRCGEEVVEDLSLTIGEPVLAGVAQCLSLDPDRLQVPACTVTEVPQAVQPEALRLPVLQPAPDPHHPLHPLLGLARTAVGAQQPPDHVRVARLVGPRERGGLGEGQGGGDGAVGQRPVGDAEAGARQPLGGGALGVHQHAGDHRDGKAQRLVPVGEKQLDLPFLHRGRVEERRARSRLGRRPAHHAAQSLPYGKRKRLRKLPHHLRTRDVAAGNGEGCAELETERIRGSARAHEASSRSWSESESSDGTARWRAQRCVSL